MAPVLRDNRGRCEESGATGDRVSTTQYSPAAATYIERHYSSAVPESDCGRNSSGSLAIFLLSNLASRMCGSLFLLHEAQIADNGEQPLSDGRFGVAGKVEKSIEFILVRLHLR